MVKSRKIIKRNKRKGFTLIELLAVILILGIIALIAIPTVNNIISESRKGAFKASVQNILSAVEHQCQIEQLKGDPITNYYVFEDGEQIVNLDIKGESPRDGSITVDNECNVELVLNKDDYIAVKTAGSNTIEIVEEKYYTTGTEVTYDPGDSTYSSWHVLKDNGDTITLLLDRNIGIGVEYRSLWADPSDYTEAGGTGDDYTSLGAITALKNLNNYTSGWSTEARANIRLITKEDILGILGINEWDEEILYIDTKSSVAPDEIGTSKYAWLYGNIGCIDSSCTQKYQTYWTGSKANTKGFVYMIGSGSMYAIFNYKDEPIPEAIIGQIRPVITIPKASVQ